MHKRALISCPFIFRNSISHFLSLIPYKEVPREKIKMPPLQKRKGYEPPAMKINIVPDRY
ncbi:MAG: hypothetical protein RIG61_07010 [Deltaproteobacteria bacterium]